MKTYNSTMMALIFIMGLSACSQRNNKHQALLNWLDSNEHTFSLDNEMSEDSAIIRVLASVADYNQQLSELGQQKSSPIELNTAKSFYKNYKLARDTARALASCPNYIKFDSSQAVLFKGIEFFKAFRDAFNPQGLDMSKPNYWAGKSFLIYPANYGVNGRDASGTNRLQGSAILQFAEDVDPDEGDLDDWKVIPNKLFDFGELKPPKIRITNEEEAPTSLN